MHLQSSLEDFDVFVRTLSIGAESMVMYYEPDRPLHDRYQIRHEFLPPELGSEVVTFSRLVNALFRWEFNSSRDDRQGRDDVPDRLRERVAGRRARQASTTTSRGRSSALVKWSAFCLATGRESRVIDQDTRAYFAVGDRDDLDYAGKLAEYRRLADDYFEVDAYEEFCADVATAARRAPGRVRREPRVRRPARAHGHRDLPGARARAVRRALPRDPRRLDAGSARRGAPLASRVV